MRNMLAWGQRRRAVTIHGIQQSLGGSRYFELPSLKVSQSECSRQHLEHASVLSLVNDVE